MGVRVFRKKVNQFDKKKLFFLSKYRINPFFSQIKLHVLNKIKSF